MFIALSIFGVIMVVLLSYGIIRCFTEIFRQPDSHIGFLMLERLTMGQLLSLPMALIGAMILIISYRNVS